MKVGIIFSSCGICHGRREKQKRLTHNKTWPIKVGCLLRWTSYTHNNIHLKSQPAVWAEARVVATFWANPLHLNQRVASKSLEDLYLFIPEKIVHTRHCYVHSYNHRLCQWNASSRFEASISQHSALCEFCFRAIAILLIFGTRSNTTHPSFR